MKWFSFLWLPCLSDATYASPDASCGADISCLVDSSLQSGVSTYGHDDMQVPTEVSLLQIMHGLDGERKSMGGLGDDVQGSPLDASKTALVNTFIGTGGHGHTFPGATTPWGMVQATPWCHNLKSSGSEDTSWDSQSGYFDTGLDFRDEMIFFGMAHTAFSGAGSGELGELRLLPGDGEYLFLDKKFTQASPGYFSTRVHPETEARGKDDLSIGIESSASPRGAIHRFTFPPGKRSLSLHLEPVPQSFGGNELHDFWTQAVSDRRIEGCTLNLLTGWGGPMSVLCFVVEFDTPFTARIEGTADRESEGSSPTLPLDFPETSSAPTSSVLARVGVSRTDIEHARANFHVEIEGKKFEEVKDVAQRMWEKELNAIQVALSPAERARTFYSALYHAMIAPNLISNVDGSYRIARLPPNVKSAPEAGDPYYWWADRHGYKLADLDDTMPIRHASRGVQYGTFSLWDTYRSLHPLYNLVWPDRARDFAESLLTFAEEWKMLPRSEVYSSTSDMMAGDGG